MILATLAVAFTAFCIWLVVRLVNRRERWAKWTAAVVVALSLYSLSEGPAIWLILKLDRPEWMHVVARFVYTPPYWAIGHGPEELKSQYYLYLGWWMSMAG